MAEKKRGPQAKSKVKPSETKQKTLFDLFPKKVNLLSNAPVEVNQESHNATAELNPVFSAPTNAGESEEISTAVVVEKFRQASLEPRPIHPFFAKPTPSVQPSNPPPENSGAQVIEIVDDNSSSNASPEDLTEPLPLSQEGGSQEDPIVLDSSPMRPIRTRSRTRDSGISKPLAPLFFRRPIKTSAVVTVTPQAAQAKHLDAPYPDEQSQHVRGPQQAFTSPDITHGRRTRNEAPSSGGTLDETSQLLKRNLNGNKIYHPIPSQYILSTTAERASLAASISDDDQQHPAITRFTTRYTASSSTHRLWVDKWHPIRAEEVLGNEGNALYLRDWLSALELHLATNTAALDRDEHPGGMAKGRPEARGSKRPRVVRAIEKRRGRKKRRIDSDEEDDWIVYSDAAEDEDEPIDFDNLDAYSDGIRSSPPLPHDDSSTFLPSSPVRVPEPEAVARHSFDPLTNTILLAGPSGTGKTAAIYACAEELGWDVFEVYPGIGKRNGPGIDNLIGDAGKNHHVRKTRTGDASALSEHRNALTTLFKASMGKLLAEQTTVDIEAAPPPSEDFGFIALHPTGPMETTPVVRQSLILLEEVDILFKEDASFWPAVTNFIKDCRRPVICTCNDISLVPTQDLPLQAILHFQPCPPPLAASYLQGLCTAEGYALERDVLLQLYRDSAFKLDSIDIPDSPTLPSSVDFPTTDLRRTINCLQFHCSSADSEIENTPGWEPVSDSITDMCNWNWSIEQLSRKSPDGPSADQDSFITTMRTEAPHPHWSAAGHADLISFVDSHLMRSPWDTPEALSWSSCEPSNDDEIGHRVLFCPRTAESFGIRDRDEEIASTAMWLSREALNIGVTQEPTSIGISLFQTRELFRARVDHQLQMAQALGGVVPLSTLKMRRAEVQMDYEASIRNIVAAEDLEALVYLQKERSGRMTRNSGRAYVRTLVLSPESREALALTVLPHILI